MGVSTSTFYSNAKANPLKSSFAHLKHTYHGLSLKKTTGLKQRSDLLIIGLEINFNQEIEVMKIRIRILELGIVEFNLNSSCSISPICRLFPIL